jgi:NADH:ubiquinone oxidoreductase subunit F (NADH-binding)
MEIVKALKESGLTGLGGAGFPTFLKWQMVKDSPDQKRFVVCNLSEGEPGVFKDEYIINHHLSELVAGIELAANSISAQKSYVFLNDKYKKYIKKIHRVLLDKKIEIFIDTGRYLCGEETVLLQVMEGKLRQPRRKPPFPTEKGLFGFRTLINNAETLHRAYLVSKENYSPKRFYSLSGDYVGKKIVEAEVCAKIPDIIGLKSSDRSIKFLRIGGLSGYFIPAEKMDQMVKGIGSIEVFGKRAKIMDALVESISFLKSESCGKCTPCREGTYRIAECVNKLLDSKSLWDRREIIEEIAEIAENAEESSFCALGRSINLPVSSAIKYFRTELSGE